MKLDLISTMVAISGIIFVLISLAIILLGKKVGEGGKQIIKIGNKVDISTNSAITLVLIFSVLVVVPLVLKYWKPDLSNYMHKTEVEDNYLYLDNLAILVYGPVLFENEQLADSVEIELVRHHHQSSDTTRYQLKDKGYYEISLMDASPDAEFTLVWKKPGYIKERFDFKFNRIRLTRTLRPVGRER